MAAVGLTETAARDRDHDVHAHVKHIRELGKARAVGETEGFVKLVLDRTTRSCSAPPSSPRTAATCWRS